MTVVQLRELARANKVRLPYGVNKAQMVETLFRQLGSGMKPAQAPAEQPDIGLYKPKPLGFYDEEYGTSNPVVPQMLKAGLLGSGHGLLEVQPGGYGFLRAQNGTPGADDIYVSIAQIRRFNLHSGDEIVGKTRPKRMGDRYNALMYIESVNGENPEIARVRRPFDSLTPIHPNRRLTLEGEGEPGDPSMRLMDFIAPIGLGQRALIVAPPHSGKTELMQSIASAIRAQHPRMPLMTLLLGERPEDITAARAQLPGEVVAVGFDEPLDSQTRCAEMVLERAMRLAEQKKDVIVFIDNLTNLCRAYNESAPQAARMLPGGLAANALAKPRHLFGAARALREGGSLTIIAVLTADPDDSSISQLRYLGYQRALRDFGLTEHPEDLICASDFTIANAYAAMQKRLRSPADFTAVFAIADDMAIGAMRALRESGRSVPSDCSVIAIDGISVSEYIHPMLTTLCQPMTAMGETSVGILLDIIEGRSGHRHVTLPTELRKGASVQRPHQ